MKLTEREINLLIYLKNSKEEKEGYTFIFSTGISEEDRDKKKARKGKGKGRSLEGMENAGVGMVISNKAKRSLIDFEQIKETQEV